MLQPKSIKIDVIGDKFHYQGYTDLSWLGFHALKKFQHYTSEICINNLYDLSQNAKKYNWILEYSDIAQSVRKVLLDEFKNIRNAQKFKSMLDEEIEEECNKINLYEKIPLKNYQKRTILFALQLRRCCLSLEMGLGKSAIGCTLAEHLYRNKLIRRGSILIIAPKSLHNEQNWEGEVEKFSNLTMLNLRKDIDDIHNPYCDMFIINADQLRGICFDGNDKYIKDNVLAKKNFECVIFDESSKLKTHNSKTREVFYQLSKHLKYCFLMSGLPAPNSIFQLWGVTSCIGNWLGDSYTAFEQRYGRAIKMPTGKEKYFPRQNAEAEIKERVELITISMTKAEYLKLPKYNLEHIYVDMNNEHGKMYKEIEEDYIYVLKTQGLDDEFEIHADNVSSARNKLLQTLSGFVYYIDEFKNKKPIRLDWNPKLDSIVNHCKTDLSDPTNHVIIWTRFREELHILYERLSEDWLCAYGLGGMTDDEQNAQLTLWLKNPECRIMIAHPGAFMYGHTWNKANFTYYASAVDDNEQYSQSRHRNYRFGQTREVTEKRFLIRKTLEKNIWDAIEQKIRLDKFLKNILHL